jgi:hypothetical protein
MKEYQGNGYGKKLFLFFEHFIHDQGCNSIVYYAYVLQQLPSAGTMDDETCCLKIKGKDGTLQEMHMFHKSVGVLILMDCHRIFLFLYHRIFLVPIPIFLLNRGHHTVSRERP